jgi:hypothetical protein
LNVDNDDDQPSLPVPNEADLNASGDSQEKEGAKVEGSESNGDDDGGGKEDESDDEDANDEQVEGPNNSTAAVSASNNGFPHPQKSEYEILREKNIAENNAILAAIKAKYPIEGEGVKLKETASATKKKGLKGNTTSNQGDGNRRASARLNGCVRLVASMSRQYLLTRTYDCSASTSVDVNQQISDQQSDKTPVNLPSGTTSAIETGDGMVLSVLSLSSIVSYLIDQVGSSPPIPKITPTGTSADVQTTPAAVPSALETASQTQNPTNDDVEMTDATGDSIEKTLQPDTIDENLQTAAQTQNLTKDDVMTDATGDGIEKTLQLGDVDENLPDWLSSTTEYLRGISSDNVWQTLITQFFLFEKSGPPSGVCLLSTIYVACIIDVHCCQKLPTKFRPEALATWIRSKKKTVVPPFARDKFYAAYTDWYNSLQPAWRMQEDGQAGQFRLSRNPPQDETWQVLRKGGSAGIYFVIMGLSWWLHPDTSDRNTTAYADAWTIVGDLCWIIQQMRNISHVEQSKSPKPKRVQEADDDEASGRSTP